MIKFGLRKNLPADTLYNSQLGSLIFMCGMIFKVCSLPGHSAEFMQSSAFWSYLVMTLFDMAPLVLSYIFMRKGGDPFLTSVNSRSYKILLFALMLFISLKCVIFFAFTSIYLTQELFTGVSPSLLLVIYLVPIVYLGIKGVRPIARCCEILMPISFVIIIMNFAFIDTNMDFGRNLPVFAVPPQELLLNSLRFGPWLGDALPFMFIKTENKKLPFIGINSFLVVSIILLNTLFGIAMYGDALSSVVNLLIRISSFNQLSTQIGRMEWTALFVVLTMTMLTLSYLYWATTACCQRICGSKKPMQIVLPVLLLAVVLGAPSIETIADASVSELGFVMFGLAMLLPAAFLTVFAVAKKKFKIMKASSSPSGAQTDKTAEDGSEDPQMSPNGPQPGADAGPAAYAAENVFSEAETVLERAGVFTGSVSQAASAPYSPEPQKEGQ